MIAYPNEIRHLVGEAKSEYEEFLELMVKIYRTVPENLRLAELTKQINVTLRLLDMKVNYTSKEQDNMYTKCQKVNIDDTRFIYATNFSGDPSRDRFGSDKRRVNVVIPTQEQADYLVSLGVKVKQTKPNPERTYDEPYVPTLYVPVNVNMDSKWPPRVYWITTAGKRLLCDADTVGQLDFIRVKNVCLQANLVEKRNAPGEYSLYADVMYVEQDADADPYAERYARYATPEADMAEPDDPNDMPY